MCLALLTVVFMCYGATVKRDASIKESHPVVRIDVSQPARLDGAADFKSVVYIPLETTDASLISKIEKLYLTGSSVLIFDSKQMILLLFDNRGRYLRQIGTKGEGPDDYLFFNDVVYEEETGLVYAHERYRNQIYTYDLTGKLVGKTPRGKYSFNSFCKTQAGFWVYSCFKGENNPEGYNLMLLDDDLQVCKAAYFPQKAFINAVFSSTFTSDENGVPYFYYPTSNILYRLEGTTATAALEIDFGSKTLPYASIAQMSTFEEYEKLVSGQTYFTSVNRVKVQDGLFYFTFMESGENVAVAAYSCLFDAKHASSKIYAHPFIDRCSYPVSSALLAFGPGRMVYALYPMMIDEKSLPLTFENGLFPVDAESNPVLAVFERK